MECYYRNPLTSSYPIFRQKAQEDQQQNIHMANKKNILFGVPPSKTKHFQNFLLRLNNNSWLSLFLHHVIKITR